MESQTGLYRNSLLRGFLLFVVSTTFLSQVHAEITTVGDVTPDPTMAEGETLYVGKGANGEMTINSGSFVESREGILGNEALVTGTVTVDGSGSTWDIKRNASIGEMGTGTLAIRNGGAVISSSTGFGSFSSVGNLPGSIGSVTVDGSGSIWDIKSNAAIGEMGTGTLTIQNGGAVISGDTGFGGFSGVGSDADSIGMVTVDGDGATWDVREKLWVGSEGDGTLTIQNGGAVSHPNDANIGSEGNGRVIVDGSGSTWEIGRSLMMGGFFAGTGTLTIQNGGTVSASLTVFVNHPIHTGSRVDFQDGTLTAGSVFASPDDVGGVGTINTGGWACDSDLILDQPEDLVHHDIPSFILLLGSPQTALQSVPEPPALALLALATIGTLLFRPLNR